MARWPRPIAVAEFGETDGRPAQFAPPVYSPNDVTAFCAKYDRGAPNASVVPVNLTPLTPAQLAHLPRQGQSVALDEAGRRSMMDVKIIASLCPKAKVLVYFATFDQRAGSTCCSTPWSRGATGLPVAALRELGERRGLSTDWSSTALDAIGDRLQIASMLPGSRSASPAARRRQQRRDVREAERTSTSRGELPFVLAVGGTMIKGATRAAGGFRRAGASGKGSGALGRRREQSSSSDLRGKPSRSSRSTRRRSMAASFPTCLRPTAGDPGYDLLLEVGSRRRTVARALSAPTFGRPFSRARERRAARHASKQRFRHPSYTGQQRAGALIGAAVVHRHPPWARTSPCRRRESATRPGRDTTPSRRGGACRTVRRLSTH